jgi:hypothetical protein
MLTSPIHSDEVRRRVGYEHEPTQGLLHRAVSLHGKDVLQYIHRLYTKSRSPNVLRHRPQLGDVVSDIIKKTCSKITTQQKKEHK